MNARRGTLTGYECPKCNNEGYIYFKNILGDIDVGICSCMKIRRAKAGMTFKSYEAKERWQQAVKGRAEKYLERGERWFFIGGQVGSGKTHICKAILTQLSEKHDTESIHWVEMSRFLKAVVNTQDYQDKMRRLKSAEVLLIDDLFYGSVTEADKALAREIIDSRYINELKTIINSEKTISEIAYVDEGTAGRIKERAGEFVINLNKDQRKDMRI